MQNKTYLPFRFVLLVLFVSSCSIGTSQARAETADLILHHGKVVTVDRDFTVAEAIAVKAGRIIAVGKNGDVLKTKGAGTQVVDLKGRMLMPGLMDSHTHPTGAAMHEFDHDIPDMQSVQDVLDYVAGRAKVLDDGEWVFVSQVFITRLKERRYPTRLELDSAAPKNPVMFRTGPDASLNSLALKRSGIDKDFKGDGGAGHVERDAKTGEPTGILRGCTRYAKYKAPKTGKTATEQDRYHRLLTLFKDYNSVGITSIGDRAAEAGEVHRYKRMLDHGDLPVRVRAMRHVPTEAGVRDIQRAIDKVAADPLCKGDSRLRIIGIKIFLDGGMLTGSARMRKPWGRSSIYSIDDPNYKGVFRTDPKKLAPIIETAYEHGLQFTAHSVGDGAVHALIDAYIEVEKRHADLRKTRPCITHCNFMSAEAVEKMAAHHIIADIQPAWLWLDTRTLSRQFSYDRLRYFQPLASLFARGVIVGGGSDHMQKIGSLRAVNPYNPWLGMWVTITRKARDYEGQLHREEALTRQQAIRFYTINNAFILFLDDVAGSLEPGKDADLIVIDRDILKCPVNDIRHTKVLRTYLKGKLVYERKG